MKISTRVRYASRIMLDLALSKGSSPIPGKDIAERQGISQSYLDNLMGPLRAAGLVRTVRGTSGGYILAKPPAEIKLNDIWTAMEGSVCLVYCIHRPDLCPRHEQCITRDIWQEANQSLNAILESWNLEDMKNKAKID